MIDLIFLWRLLLCLLQYQINLSVKFLTSLIGYLHVISFPTFFFKSQTQYLIHATR